MASNIIVLAFNEGEFIAEGMLDSIMKLQEDGLIDVEDAVIASRGVSENIKIKQTHSVKGKYTLRGSGAGFLAGLILGGPIGGLVVGAVAGAVAGSMKDYGIDDDSIKEISKGLGPNSSALFLQVKEVAPENVAQLDAELRKFKAIVVKTTLPEEKEAELRKIFAKEEYGSSGEA